MKLHSIRLLPGQDLQTELLAFASNHRIRSGSIVTCVGAIKPVIIRLAGATPDDQAVRTYKDTYEIVSLVGTLTADNCHLHIAFSDREGNVIGGHLKIGSLVDLTAEIVIAEDESAIYTREFDSATGFRELVVTPS